MVAKPNLQYLTSAVSSRQARQLSQKRLLCSVVFLWCCLPSRIKAGSVVNDHTAVHLLRLLLVLPVYNLQTTAPCSWHTAVRLLAVLLASGRAPKGALAPPPSPSPL